MSKLAVIVIGNRNSGKSTTWNELFGERVKTGSKVRELELTSTLIIPVFLVSGSPEERKRDLEDIIRDADPNVVLCSLQYAEHARESTQYFVDHGFSLFVQWLNPGYSDDALLPDRLGLIPFLLHHGALMSIRNGKSAPKKRVNEIKKFLIGWESDC